MEVFTVTSSLLCIFSSSVSRCHHPRLEDVTPMLMFFLLQPQSSLALHLHLHSLSLRFPFPPHQMNCDDHGEWRALSIYSLAARTTTHAPIPS